MLKVLHQDKDPKVLVITPLLSGHLISGETKTTIKRNKTPIIWVGYMSPAKHAANVQAGLQAYRKKFKSTPPYLLVLDRDIIMGRKMIDKMLLVLEKTGPEIGYTYVPFAYSGHINVSFAPREFDINQLLRGNYISSNSLYKIGMIDKVGGFVVEEDVHRMSDWCMWLKAYKHGYNGKLCPDASFIAMSSAGDISAGSNEEYQRTFGLIVERYIKPLLQH